MSLFHDPANPLDTFWHRTFGPVVGSVVLFILEVVQIIIISFAIILPIRYFLILPFYVKGQSMEPTYYNHEYLIIDELTYRFQGPQRGDVIVFYNPMQDRDQITHPDFFIKRVIGLPGEKVEVREGKVFVYNDEYPNGIILDEPYLTEITETGTPGIVTVGEGEYFVLGDNRNESYDSRTFGPISLFDEKGRRSVIGKVWFRGLPISRIGLFDAPEYNL